MWTRIRRGGIGMGRGLLDRTGEKRLSNRDREMIITDYRGNNDIDVYFPQYDWTAEGVSYKSFRLGSILCPYEPNTAGVGCLGEGKYPTRVNGKQTKLYHSWATLMNACYNPYHPEYQYYGEEGYTVCEDWCNFQNYAQWYTENCYTLGNHKIVLSSKIMNEDKVISPVNSIFIPFCLSQLVRKNGVTYNPTNKGYDVKIYYTTLDRENHYEYFGTYKDQEQAKLVYKKNKERIVRMLAEEYKDHIPTKFYNYIKDFVLDINDIRNLSEEGGNN